MTIDSLKKRFRVQRQGDLTLNWIKVLAYLDSSNNGSRESSAEKLGKEIGVPENVITEYAYPALLKNGYIKRLADNLPERDANSYEVTQKGRRALGNFLNAVGLVELGVMVGISLVVGATIGFMYPIFLQYPSYLTIILGVAVLAGMVELFFLSVFVWMARKRRREVLSIMLQKPERI